MQRKMPRPVSAIIRTFVFYGFSVVAALPFLRFLPVVVFAPRWGKQIVTKYFATQLFFLHVICGFWYVFEGRENLPEAPFMFASQHRSTWENFFFQDLLEQPAMFAKKEIFNYPVAGSIARVNDHILIDRNGSLDGMRVAFKKAVDISKTGRNILIYPTGTRIVEKQDEIPHGVSVFIG